MTTQNIDTEALADHLIECDQQYHLVCNRLDSIETRMIRMEILLSEILHNLKS
jgi:hypothetical protein